MSDVSQLPFSHERHGSTERRLSALKLPREAPENHALILQLRRFDLSTQILDMHAILGEQRVVRELVGTVGEHLVDRRLAAELLLRLGAHLVAVAVLSFTQET